MTTIRNCAWGPVRSPAELEDLWAIDNAAYAKLQSPTKSSGLVVVLPLRLAGRSLAARLAWVLEDSFFVDGVKDFLRHRERDGALPPHKTG